MGSRVEVPAELGHSYITWEQMSEGKTALD